MRKMKDSGVEWIGEIPEGWELSKIGAVYDNRNIKVSDTEYAPLSITKQGVVPQLETAAKTDNGDNRKLVKKNDFVINSRSDRRGSCGISELDGSCSLINTVLKPRKNMCNRYYGFVFKSDLFADEFYRWGHGIVDDLWSTKWSDMKSIYIPMPSINEQERIADYLDEKCSKIDAIIARQEEIIEKLKMFQSSLISETVRRGLHMDVECKNSGYDYIGNIPSHWEICRLRNIGSPQNGISKGAEFFGHGYPFVSYGDVYHNYSLPKMVSGLIDSTEKERELYSVRNGDIFFTRTSETIEEVGFSCICEETLEDACFAGFLIRVRPYNEKMYTGYAKYYFRSNHLRSYLVKEMNLVTRASVGQDLLKSMPVLIPPWQEQQEIAQYLDKKCDYINFEMTKRTAIIEKMKEYKKSLIYEVVTGKKEV